MPCSRLLLAVDPLLLIVSARPQQEGVLPMAYYMILDTETCDKHARKTSKPEPWNSLVYDLGFVVVDS